MLRAEQIIYSFAKKYGWQNYVQHPSFDSVEIFSSQRELWTRVRELERLPSYEEPLTNALAAVILKRTLLAITLEEYARIRPQYATRKQAWPRLLAHEMAHELHLRLVHANPDAMGPKWFFEGFAIVASGQHLCGHAKAHNLAEAMSDSAHQGPGSYVYYEVAFRFFLKRMALQQLIRRAGSPDFEDWLRNQSQRHSR